MSSIERLRLMSLLEGISLVALVFVGMPLKYFAGWPVGVRVAGSVHGLLFLMFIVSLFQVAVERRWKLSRSLVAVGAAVVPFGAFVLARALRRSEHEQNGSA